MTIEVEGWENHVFKIAIDMLCKDNIFVRQEENEIVVGIAIGSDSLEKVRNEDFATTHTRWLSWGTAIEMLMKSVFLKHLPSAIVTKDIKNPRKFANIGFKGADSKWNFMNDQQITDWGMISLGTMQRCIENLDKLAITNKLNSPIKTDQDLKELKTKLSYVKTNRRNKEAHLILKYQVKWNVDQDLNDIIIPSINQLIKIFNV